VILRKFRRALRESGNPIARSPVALRQCIEQASAIVGATVDQLRRGPQPESAAMSLSREIGESRAAASIHPADSLRAARLLFRIVTDHLAAHLELSPSAAREVIRAIAVLDQNITQRITEAMLSYASYLLKRINDANIAERQRIGREIHDGIGHDIALAHQFIQMFEMQVSQQGLPVDHRVQVAQESLGAAMANIRGLIKDLRLLTPTGNLESALLEYARSVPDVNVKVVVNGDDGWAAQEVRDQVFLVIREALRNAFRHARAVEIRVTIDIGPDELRATIGDDGVGFDLRRANENNGSGLASMRERAALLGGLLRLSSLPGEGTWVEILIPLPGGT
jgi:signal transduction histidine kinase